MSAKCGYRKIGRPPAPIVNGEKRCTRCDTWKPVAAFGYNSQASVTRLKSWCRQCMAEQRKDHKARNPDQAKAKRERDVVKRKVNRDRWLRSDAQWNEPDERLTKTCRLCAETKPLTAYWRKWDGELGRTSDCRPCRVAINRERRAAKAKAKPPRQTREEALAKKREYMRDYRKRQKETVSG